MHAKDSVAFASLGRSIFNFRRDQSMESGAGGERQDALLLGFQSCIEEVLVDLSAAARAEGDGLLSIAWLRRLLDGFLLCHEEFRALLLDRGEAVARPPVDRLVADYYDRAIKALDICNAARDGIEQLRRWRAHLEIVVAALKPAAGGGRGISEGQVRRARKALADLAVLMLDDRDAGSATVSHRNRSFDRSGGSGSSSASSSKTTGRKVSSFRSLSWSVSGSWSAARQLQSIGSNLAAPRGHEVAATAGLAVPVYTMNAVLLFTMLSLVAAIPCQDRGLQVHFAVSRTLPWAPAITYLHERIVESSKKRERKNSAGLLKEILQIERCTQQMAELVQVSNFPMAKGEEEQLRERADELAQICDAMKDGLEPLERQLREIFRRIVRSRTESLNLPAHTAN
ncbi:protein ROH1D-like [Curcuma longa]|uniref:protein ROH1D-like n=1 Tax=Curcuma longa TaxID=136217 RepID=UPI003D9E3950